MYFIPNSEDNWIDIDEMRTSDVKDESLKAKFIHTLENVEEEKSDIGNCYIKIVNDG